MSLSPDNTEKSNKNSYSEIVARQKRLDMTFKDDMDFYTSRYFVINMNMMRLIGIWPYQKKITKTILRVLVSICLLLPITPQIIRMVLYKTDLEVLVMSVGTFLYFSGKIIQYDTCIIFESRLKIMYKYIVANWKFLKNENEIKLMKEHSEMGRFLTLVYLGYMFNAGLGFMFLPISPRLINMIFPIFNGSIIEMLILEGEYLIDKQDYYYYIYFFELCCIPLSVVVFGTVDSTYAVCVQQCVGLYAVVKLRLKLATQEKLNNTDYQTLDSPYHEISKAAALHEEVLKFGRVLETSFSTTFLLIMAFTTLIVVALAVSILFNLNNPVLLVRHLAIMLGCSIQLFYLSWPGQKLIDASDDVFFAAYDNEWYECSIKSQQLLKFIMRQTIEPFCLTAGGFYIMNFENFEMLMKTAMSYITVLVSFK